VIARDQVAPPSSVIRKVVSPSLYVRKISPSPSRLTSQGRSVPATPVKPPDGSSLAKDNGIEVAGRKGCSKIDHQPCARFVSKRYAVPCGSMATSPSAPAVCRPTSVG
jgi:hypothetical protein